MSLPHIKFSVAFSSDILLRSLLCRLIPYQQWVLCCSCDCTSNTSAVAVSSAPLTGVHVSTKTFSESSLSPSFSSENRNLDGTAFGNHLGIYPAGFPLLNFCFLFWLWGAWVLFRYFRLTPCNQVLRVEVNKRLRQMLVDNWLAACNSTKVILKCI